MKSPVVYITRIESFSACHRLHRLAVNFESLWMFFSLKILWIAMMAYFCPPTYANMHHNYVDMHVINFCQKLFFSKGKFSYLRHMSVRSPKNFSSQNPFAQGPFAHWSWTYRVRSPLFYVIITMYNWHTMAYHRSCVMLIIQTVNSLKSVHISSTIFKN